VALRWLLGCTCIFSLGHSCAHWFGLKNLRRTENNGIVGSRIIQEEVGGDALDVNSGGPSRWGFFVQVDLPASKEAAAA
jgi:hypothetical protein